VSLPADERPHSALSIDEHRERIGDWTIFWRSAGDAPIVSRATGRGSTTRASSQRRPSSSARPAEFQLNGRKSRRNSLDRRSSARQRSRLALILRFRLRLI
jgi:hypothetical protein